MLRSALTRFGCCHHRATDGIVETLLRRGEALTLDEHHGRQVAFGAVPPEHRAPCRVVLLRDVVAFLREYIRLHWDVPRHAECKDPAFNFLMVLEKLQAPQVVRQDDPRHTCLVHRLQHNHWFVTCDTDAREALPNLLKEVP